MINNARVESDARSARRADSGPIRSEGTSDYGEEKSSIGLGLGLGDSEGEGSGEDYEFGQRPGRTS